MLVKIRISDISQTSQRCLSIPHADFSFQEPVASESPDSVALVGIPALGPIPDK